MRTTLKLSKDISGESVDPSVYRTKIGSVLYLTASKHDIAFSVGTCARFQADPKESLLSAVKRIIRYVVGTSKFRLWYPYHHRLLLDTSMSSGLEIELTENP